MSAHGRFEVQLVKHPSKEHWGVVMSFFVAGKREGHMVVTPQQALLIAADIKTVAEEGLKQ